MSSSESSTPDGALQHRTLVPHVYVPDPTADEMDLANPSWMVATVIEDDDLMFGGKPLCAWYEEDRRRLSSSMDEEEETRGRQRERVRVDNHHHHQNAHHQHQHQHHLQPQEQPQYHHHHSKKAKDTKQ